MGLLDNKRHPILSGVLLLLILVGSYLIVAIPFKVMEVIPGFTDIRPVMLLQPIYGLFFGIIGCLASAISNLICDIVSDSLRWSSIGGFIANFLGPLVFYLFWTRISKKDFNIRNAKNLLIYCAVTLFSALVQTVIITPMVKLIYPDIQGTLFALSVMANNTLFPIFLGIPIIILLQEELGLHPKTKKERQ
ncbi:MAG: hypothetical protein IJ932_02075 [Ruminococcus sp.]|nr:hypothetical protein [Ruminococcus sp.]